VANKNQDNVPANISNKKRGEITRQKIFDFIVEYKRGHDGNSPSLRDISDAVGIVKSTIWIHLRTMEKENKIRLGKVGQSRYIEVVGAVWAFAR